MPSLVSLWNIQGSGEKLLLEEMRLMPSLVMKDRDVRKLMCVVQKEVGFSAFSLLKGLRRLRRER